MMIQVGVNCRLDFEEQATLRRSLNVNRDLLYRQQPGFEFVFVFSSKFDINCALLLANYTKYLPSDEPVSGANSLLVAQFKSGNYLLFFPKCMFGIVKELDRVNCFVISNSFDFRTEFSGCSSSTRAIDGVDSSGSKYC